MLIQKAFLQWLFLGTVVILAQMGDPSKNPLAAPDPFVGTFKSEQLTLNLQKNQEEYTGSIHFQQQKFAIKAKKQGNNTLAGTFLTPSGQFPFTASLQNKKLTFITGGSTYLLQKMVQNPLDIQPKNPLALQNKPPFAGTYFLQAPAGTNTLTLLQSGNKLSGTLQGLQVAFKVEGTVQSPQKATGYFRSAQGAVYFEAYPAPNQIKIILMDLNPQTQQINPNTKQELTFQRQKNTKNENTQLNPSQNSIPTQKMGKTYKHPLGFTFQYPSDWNIQEAQGMIALIPPNQRKNQYGQAEAYLISGENAQGITKPDDPRIIQFLEQYLRKVAPFLKRTGQPQAVQAGNTSGAILTWEGQNPMSRLQIRARIYVVILNGFAISLSAIGESKYIQEREKTLKAIFSTFGRGKGEINPQFFGSWRNTNSYRSHTPTTDFNYVSDRYMVLLPNGTFRAGGQAILGGGKKFPDGSNSSYNANTGQNMAETGKWGTRGKTLFLLWDDGSYAEYNAHIEGQPGNRNMLLVAPNGKKQLWEETR